MDKSLDYFLRSHQMLVDISSMTHLPDIKTNIGIFYYAKGNYQSALIYFQESLALFELLENNLWISSTLLYYILTYCEIDLTKARNLLLKLKQITESEKTKSKLIDLRYQFANSVVLIKTNRLENIVKAKKILYQIVETDEIIDYGITLMAMKHFADLLILELKLNDDEKIPIQLINLISKLNNNAMIHGSHSTQVQTYILFAKFNLLSGDFQSAIDSLDKAKKIANETGLEKYVKEVLFEKEQIVQTANMYERAYGDLTNILEKLQQANIETYLNEILANGFMQYKQNNGQ